MATVSTDKLKEVAKRIREMREICDITETDMAKKTEVSLEDYRAYENGELDFPFTFIHKCSLAFGIGITDLLEGQSAHLSSYTVTRKGQGPEIDRNNQYKYQSLAVGFKDRKVNPFMVQVDPLPGDKKPNKNGHDGQEYDYVIEGQLEVTIEEKVMVLNPGDSIYFDSRKSHCFRSLNNEPAKFLCIII